MGDNTKAEDIAFLIVFFSEYLGSHIPDSTALGQIRQFPPLLLLHLEGETEIDDLHLVGVDVDDNVLGLDVAVDDTAVVALPDAHEDVGQQVLAVGRRQLELHPDETHQVHPRQVLHQQHVLLVGLMELPELVDVTALLHRGQNPLLLGQHSYRSRTRIRLAHHLSGELLPGLAVTHPVDLRETALP
jgi:hypothetical protein